MNASLDSPFIQNLASACPHSALSCHLCRIVGGSQAAGSGHLPAASGADVLIRQGAWLGPSCMDRWRACAANHVIQPIWGHTCLEQILNEDPVHVQDLPCNGSCGFGIEFMRECGVNLESLLFYISIP